MSSRRRILTDTGRMIADALMILFILGIVALAIAGFVS